MRFDKLCSESSTTWAICRFPQITCGNAPPPPRTPPTVDPSIKGWQRHAQPRRAATYDADVVGAGEGELVNQRCAVDMFCIFHRHDKT